jgi:hypothetical protein
MRTNFAAKAALSGLLALGLVACGGSSGTTTLVTADPAGNLTSSFGAGLSALNTKLGLQSAAFLGLFAPNFLDAGYTQAQLADNLAKDAVSLDGATGVSLFPMVSLSNATVVCTGTSNVCTLTGTITNVDADVTETTFSTAVILTNGSFRLLGDQTNG